MIAPAAPDAGDAGAVRAPTRRAVLGAAVGSGLGFVLAACTSGAKPGPSSTSGPSGIGATSTRATGTAPTLTGTSSGSSSGSLSGSATSATSAAPSSAPAKAGDYGALSRQLHGQLLRPGQAGFTSAAQLYNPRFDDAPTPVALARCANEQDLVDCVRFAATTGVPLALRAGGHSYGGWSRTHGLVADLRPMSSVQVDTAAKLARIGAGARLIDVYTALGAKGLAIAGGSCPTVGIAGLALGGGLGVLSRAFGLTCDAIQSARVVTADGRARTVDATHDPDLFWALRGGGGGSFGAVSSLTMHVRPAPTVHVFYLAFDFAQAADVLAAWQRWVPGRPAALWTTCKLLADARAGALHAVVAGTWIGPAGDLDAQLAPLLVGLPGPKSRSTVTRSYTAAMLLEAGCDQNAGASRCLSHALAPAQRQAFAATSSVVASALPTAGIEAAVRAAAAGMQLRHVIEAGVSFDALGGEVAAVAPSATPFPYRRALATAQYTATWASGRTAPEPFDRYVRGFRATMSRWLGASAYANYADASIADYGPAYWRANYPRLQQVKKHYDLHQLFTFAQAVRPS